MNEKKYDGGPAFPLVMNDGFTYSGLSLRDYFAAAALTGDLSAQSSETGEWSSGNLDILAKRCYAIADIMLAERNRQ